MGTLYVTHLVMENDCELQLRGKQANDFNIQFLSHCWMI
jgi:hypothetical protein